MTEYGVDDATRSRTDAGVEAGEGEEGQRGPAPPRARGAPREPETPRGELPEWLAKELFRIFV